MTEQVAVVRESGSLERGLGSIVVGLVAAVLVIISLEPALQQLYPVLEISPMGVSGEMVSGALPASSLGLLLAAYAVASFVGGLAASLTSGRTVAWPPVTTAAVLLVAGSFAIMALHQPIWFKAASLLTYPMAYVGHLAVRRLP